MFIAFSRTSFSVLGSRSGGSSYGDAVGAASARRGKHSVKPRTCIGNVRRIFARYELARVGGGRPTIYPPLFFRASKSIKFQA